MGEETAWSASTSRWPADPSKADNACRDCSDKLSVHSSYSRKVILVVRRGRLELERRALSPGHTRAVPLIGYYSGSCKSSV